MVARKQQPSGCGARLRKETQCVGDKRGHAVFLLSRFNRGKSEDGACDLRKNGNNKKADNNSRGM